MWKIIDTASLKVRLTVGVAAVAALGLGGLAAWTSMQMQQILVSSHKEDLKYIIERFPMDLEIYTEMVPLDQGAERAINNLAQPGKMIWIKDSQGQVLAKSSRLNQSKNAQQLLSLDDVPPTPQVRDLGGTYWLMCAVPLNIKAAAPGELYLAHDITRDQMLFWNQPHCLIYAWRGMVVVVVVVVAAAVVMEII
ncbi:MAG: two-component sensor histidine kinase, partial [Cyanobacteria bacterium J06558_2]